MSSPFDDPEAARLFKDMLVGLTAESHRGAVLVGTAHVDNCLRELFEAAFPAALSKKGRDQLLKYPGPLSSLSARTEIAYSSRLISRRVYDALHALRRLRNDVAHSPDAFELVGQECRYRSIFELGPALPAEVHQLAFEIMLEYKTAVILKALQELRAEDPEVLSLITHREEAAAYIKSNPDVFRALEHQLPQWELAVGLGLLCSMLIRFRNDAARVLGPDRTIGRLGKPERFGQPDA